MKQRILGGFLCALGCVTALTAHAVPVNFADANLEQAVRDAFDDLGQPLGGTIDSDDLVGVGFTELSAIGLNIASLDGLEFATDLELLDLSMNALSDISPLASLTNLEWLDLGSGTPTDGLELDDQDNNFITDVSPLANLTNLMYLNLAGNRSLTNIAPLAPIAGGLQFFILGYSPIADFSVISGMTGLERLGIFGCGMTDADLGAIAGLTQLLTLFLPENELVDISALSSLTGLLDLNISFNSVVDISLIENIVDPEFLFLDNNQITDLTALVNNTNIGGADVVNVGGNPLSNDAACNQIPVIEARFDTGIFAFDAVCADIATLTINIVGTGTTNFGTGEVEFEEGETVNLIAVPIAGSGFAFDEWQGAASGTQMFVEIEMTEDKTVTAVFVTPGVHELTVSQAGAGNGTTVPEPGVYSYLDGRTAVLTAFPDENSDFAGWTGDATSVTPFLGVLMNGDKSVTANFATAGQTFDLVITQNGDGSVDPAPGTYTLAAGAQATLTAIPDPGWEFDGWTGDIGGADANNQIIQVSLTQNRNITANFVPDGLDFTLFIDTVGQGATTPNGPFARFLDGQEVELFARTVADSGFAFDRWEGDLDSTSAVESITMDSDKSVTAVFVSPGDHTLNITNNGGSNLSVFPPAGAHAYLDGRTALIAAFPQPGEFFGGFSGDATSIAPVIEVEMDGDKNITATFSDQGFDLTINVSGQGTTTPQAGETYAIADGTVATLFATPTVTGWVFSEWQGDIGAADPSDPELVLTIDQNRNVTAVFVEDGFDWTLDIGVVGDGSTDPEPGESRWFDGEQVFLNPVGIPGSGFAFLEWQGDINSTEEFVSITMNSDKAVEAVFVEGDHDLTINIAGPGEGSTFPLPGVQSYVNGRFATLTAFPEPGSFFGGWSGDVTELSPVITIFMDEDKEVTATFVEDGVTLTLAIQGQGSTEPGPGVIPVATGAFITLTAFDSVPGWRFSEWTGDIGNNEPSDRSIQVFMGIDRNITAVFEEVQFDATLTLQASGPGTTTPVPGEYGFLGLQNTQFVTAVPDAGAIFLGWQGDIGSANPQATGINLLMDQDRTVTAVFAQPDFELTVNRVGDGGVSPTPGAYGFASGAEVTLTATNINESGFLFDRWEGDLGGEDPTAMSITVTMDQDREITAIFLAETTLTLSISGTGETDPEPGAYTFKSNESVVLTASEVEASGFAFLEWQGDIGDADASSPTIELDMDQDRSVTAVFTEIVTLTIAVENDGTTNPEPGVYTFATGSQVTIQAVNIEDSGFIFDRWEGDIGEANPTANPLVLTLTEDAAITAVFEEGAFDLFSHSADQDGNGVISLSEILRVVQFFNSGGFSCATTQTEDGYQPNTNGTQDCTPHSSDYNPQNWQISLSELLRLVQFFNSGGYFACPNQTTEDGFCPGQPPVNGD